MSDEGTDNFDISAAMTQDEFSFFDVLNEISYPKDEFSVYLDESAAFDFRKIQTEIDTTTEPDAERVEDWDARLEDIRTRLAKSKFTFYVTGVSDDRIEEAAEVANAQFADKKKQRKTASGTIEKYLPDDVAQDYLRFFNAVVLSLHIERIVQNATGRTMVAPSPDEVAQFLRKAPGAAKVEVNERIQALRAKSGEFESALDVGFFPKP